ncbi:MAG: hypothetical protein RJB04_602, partial [Verrucomicrobiota bacterium]
MTNEKPSFLESFPDFSRVDASLLPDSLTVLLPRGFPRSHSKTQLAIMAKALKYVYTWGNKKADGDGSMKALLGGKGANLAEMTRIGLPVPPGFTVTTEVCTYFYAHKKTYPKELQSQMEAG